jgi:hypothetical protein
MITETGVNTLIFLLKNLEILETYRKFRNLLNFYYHIIGVLGVHCNIDKKAYNIS